MMNDSNKRQFEGVLVYQLDRFARNRYDSATNKQKLKKNGVKVLSARENITDDASGVLMESVLEGMAEYFSRELSLYFNSFFNKIIFLQSLFRHVTIEHNTTGG